jgi:hypothetical protein
MALLPGQHYACPTRRPEDAGLPRGSPNHPTDDSALAKIEHLLEAQVWLILELVLESGFAVEAARPSALVASGWLPCGHQVEPLASSCAKALAGLLARPRCSRAWTLLAEERRLIEGPWHNETR